jgi:hypothetical protein
MRANAYSLPTIKSFLQSVTNQQNAKTPCVDDDDDDDAAWPYSFNLSCMVYPKYADSITYAV